MKGFLALSWLFIGIVLSLALHRWLRIKPFVFKWSFFLFFSDRLALFWHNYLGIFRTPRLGSIAWWRGFRYSNLHVNRSTLLLLAAVRIVGVFVWENWGVNVWFTFGFLNLLAFYWLWLLASCLFLPQNSILHTWLSCCVKLLSLLLSNQNCLSSLFFHSFCSFYKQLHILCVDFFRHK